MKGTLLHPVLLAAGALCALLAMLAVFDQSWEIAYAWLGCGLLADMVLPQLTPEPDLDETGEPSVSDPTDERRVRSAITFLLSVFVPVLALLQAGFLDGLMGIIIAALVLLSGVSRLRFHQWAEEVPEYEGFPAAWAAVGFTLHAFDATPTAATLLIGTILILGLAPIHWPHPAYATRWTLLTRAVTLIWAVSAASVLWHGFPATTMAKSVLILSAVYAAALALARMVTDEQEPPLAEQTAPSEPPRSPSPPQT